MIHDHCYHTPPAQCFGPQYLIFSIFYSHKLSQIFPGVGWGEQGELGELVVISDDAGMMNDRSETKCHADMRSQSSTTRQHDHPSSTGGERGQ